MSAIQRLLASPHKAVKAGALADIIDDNAEHDAGWPADRRWLCAMCTKAHIKYDELADMLQLSGYPRPSMGDHAYRVVLVELLAVEGATLATVIAGAGGDSAYLAGLVGQ
jgi:hypothetical protein